MWQNPSIFLGILLRLAFATSAESLPERQLPASSSRIPIQTQENEEYRAYELSMEITNRIYNQSLEDTNSDYYVKLSDDVKNLLEQIFGCLTCDTYSTYRGATEITFSNGSGSVIADSTLVFNTDILINGEIIHYIFSSAIEGTDLNTNISVNPTYTDTPVTVPVPVMITTPPPTTTSLSVPTNRQSVHSTTQYHPDISPTTDSDSDLSKVTGSSHNIPDSTYTSTLDPITDTATTLSHVTDRLDSSPTTSSSEFTHSTSHVTNRLDSSPTTSSKNNSEFTHSTNHVTNGPDISATTLSESTTDSTETATSPLSSHVSASENTADFSRNTKNPPPIITSYTTRSSPKTDSSASWSAVNPHHTSAMPWHPSRHTNIPPRPPANATSSHNHSHVVILPTTKAKNGSAMAGSSYGGVPGWGIALLVLASVILLLLIVFFILALWHWCCRREETGLINVTGSPKPYDREPSAPEFLTVDPYRKIYPDDSDKPKKNRTGMYVVNP